jgi:crotonobetainyl-CoA:carnitine CoA-transferase CaiB-like acyl-CoA transferase
MLSPYRVLDLADERGILCGQILADLGADVIAVEPPGGSPARRIGPFRRADGASPSSSSPSPESLFWWAYARNKRGITLDLDAEDGRAGLRRLVETADILIESFAPGRMDQLGLGYEMLARINPGLVLVSISPFGQTGPKAGWAATDLTAWAATTVLQITGDEDRPPVRVPGGQAWLHAGAEAAVAALAALTARARDGFGQHVDVSAQTAGMIATQGYILQHGWGDQPAGRMGGGARMGPFRMRLVYPCKDGHVSVTFFFGSAIGPFTRRLFDWMFEEGFVDAATRDKDWVGYVPLLLSGQEPPSELDRCAAAIERFTRTKTKAALFEAAMRRGLLIVPVSTTTDARASEQLAARHFWIELEHPDGARVTYPGPFATFSATPITYRRPAPRLGEHNAEVLGEPPPRATSPPVAPQSANLPQQAGVRNSQSAPPLAGVKVLDFTWVMVGPAGVRQLADFGATVVHVESATRVDTARGLGPFKDGVPGPERSGLYATVNAGKLGLTLNLSLPEARAVAQRLAAWADVVTESYSPKAMRAWGLDYASLRQVNPSLIMLSTSLNGQSGPHAALAGFGTMGAALAGFHEVTGWPDRPPAGPFSAYTDYVVPKFIAAAILAALDHRRRTGVGQFIDLSQAEAAIHFLTPFMLDSTVNGTVPIRAGNVSAEMAPHGVYPTQGEDRWVAIACPSNDHWRALCEAAGRSWERDPRFATVADRLAHREALDAAIAAWTAPLDVAALEDLLQRAGVPVHRVSTSADAFADPQVAHRGQLPLVAHPELGPVPVEGPRALLSRTPARVRWPGPTFGQHNEQVLKDILGMDDEAIVELIVAGALE